jgi:hypothetical protein
MLRDTALLHAMHAADARDAAQALHQVVELLGAADSDDDVQSGTLVLEWICIDTADIDAALGDDTGDFIQ